MNTQKIFLFVAIFLTIFILWDKWEITQAVDANGNVVSKTAIVGVDSQDDAIDIPKASDVPLVSESTIEDNAPSNGKW